MRKFLLLFVLIFFYSCSLNKEVMHKNQDLNNYIFVSNGNIIKKGIDFNNLENFIKKNKWIFISLSDNNIDEFINKIDFLDNKDYFRLEIDKISEKQLNKILNLLGDKNITEININILKLDKNINLENKLIDKLKNNINIKKIEIIFNGNGNIIVNKDINKINILNLP